MGSELLEVEPRELKFAFELKKQIPCLVQLTNNTNHYVAFKVKTTSPKKYCVRPNAGIVLPKSIVDFTVTLQPQRVDPSDAPCRDKFLVQSTVVPFGTTEEEIKAEYFSKESGRFIEEIKMKVLFVTQPLSPMLQQLNGSFMEPAFVPPTIKEATVSENVPVIKDSNVEKEASIINESSVLKEAPAMTEHSLKDHESTILENIQTSHVPIDLDGLKSKISNLESKLNEKKKMYTLLREDNVSVAQERDRLQRELEMLRRKSVAGHRRGYPFLFVCFIGLIGIYLGHALACSWTQCS